MNKHSGRSHGRFNALYLIWDKDQLNPCPIYVMNHNLRLFMKVTNTQASFSVCGGGNYVQKQINDTLGVEKITTLQRKLVVHEISEYCDSSVVEKEAIKSNERMAIRM